MGNKNWDYTVYYFHPGDLRSKTPAARREMDVEVQATSAVRALNKAKNEIKEKFKCDNTDIFILDVVRDHTLVEYAKLENEESLN